MVLRDTTACVHDRAIQCVEPYLDTHRHRCMYNHKIVPIFVFTRIFDFIFSSWWYGLIPVHQWTSVSYLHCTAVCSCRISVRWMKFLWKQCSTAVCIVQFALCSVEEEVRSEKSKAALWCASAAASKTWLWYERATNGWFFKVWLSSAPCIPYNHFPVQCPNFILMMLSTQH